MTRSGWGFSWTRYREGISAFNAVLAAAQLAAIISCSIISSASPVVRGTTSMQRPSSSRMNLVSSLVRSIWPRARPLAFKRSASSLAPCRLSATGLYFSRISGAAVPSKMVFTSLYTPRTLETMTDLANR